VQLGASAPPRTTTRRDVKGGGIRPAGHAAMPDWITVANRAPPLPIDPSIVTTEAWLLNVADWSRVPWGVATRTVHLHPVKPAASARHCAAQLLGA